MEPHCVDAVIQAAGRALSKDELDSIETQLMAKMTEMARQDRAGWQSMTPAQRTLAAAEAAAADAQAAARLKQYRQHLQIIKTADVSAEVQALQGMYGTHRSGGLVRHMDQADAYIKGIKDQYWAQLRDVFDAAMSTDGVSLGRRALQTLFDVENPKMTRDLGIEIFARGEGGTGNKLAIQAAKAWTETLGSMRARFNSAGGDVGQLDYGYVPQPSDQGRVLAAGKDGWVAKTLPKLDRSAYTTVTGRAMNYADLTAFLGHVYETLSTGGVNKLKPGQFRGTGAKANRGSQSRQLHFKDGEAYIDYMSEFGAGSMYDAMTGHISGLSRDMGLVEKYGPNPDHQMRVQFDLAEKEDGSLKRTVANTPAAYWNVVGGKSGAVGNASLARVGADIRNIQVAGKLGRAVIASISDIPTMLLTSGYNKLGYWQTIKNIGAQASKENRDFLSSHGLIAESLVSDLNRFSGDHIRNNWSGKVANSVMKLSLMTAWTDSMRRAFQMTMMGGMGKMSGTKWGDLTEWDRMRMERKGITKNDWETINAAELTEYKGQRYLTPEAIMGTGVEGAEQVVSKVLGLIRDESEFAVINPDLATRAAQTWGGQSSGTVGGELARSVMQFKSFPFAMISRHFRRMADAPQGLNGAPAVANRLAYGTSLMLGTTVAGGVAFQIKEILSGRDPVPMDSMRFWTEAMVQGGGLSIVGDLLFNDPRDAPGGFAGNLAGTVMGPSIGSAAELSAIGIENAWRAASGDEINIGASAARTVRSNTPYGNLWWIGAAIDHTFFQALQENLSPGYLGRAERRARRQHDQDYWWQLGTGMPERGPNLTKLLGH